jgi:hypothetical protein
MNEQADVFAQIARADAELVHRATETVERADR